MDERFAFGKNWRRLHIDDQRIDEAQRGLARLLGPDLGGLSFLDVGSGSGLMSLAALRQGAARVVSFDLDAESVQCTDALRRRCASDAPWQVLRGSALDAAFLASLGTFDVVYAWGALHHTGDLWRATGLVARNVGPRGRLALAIYNRVRGHLGTLDSRSWHAIKRAYARGGPARRGAMLAAYVAWRSAVALTKLEHPLSEMRERKARGMDYFVDARDWLGGFPYEYASAREVVDFVAAHGLFPERVFEVSPDGWGCNELVFRAGDNLLHPLDGRSG
ncbi:MAG TPA: methyltransferase domain-containing protein [Polyangiaceae bacterium]|nr:methyltransferase domain-containing protein [Polyangiaceae bacterium]